MTEPTSQVTLGGVSISGYATLGLTVQYQDMGHTYLRMDDGSSAHQSFWTKKRIVISASGWLPPGISALDRSTTHTLVVPEDGGDTGTYTVHITAYSETHSPNQASASWSVTCEEATA